MILPLDEFLFNEYIIQAKRCRDNLRKEQELEQFKKEIISLEYQKYILNIKSDNTGNIRLSLYIISGFYIKKINKNILTDFIFEIYNSGI